MFRPSGIIAVVKALLVFLFASPCVACLAPVVSVWFNVNVVCVVCDRGVGLKVSSIFFSDEGKRDQGY